MTLIHIEGFEGIVPKWQHTQADTETNGTLYMRQNYPCRAESTNSNNLFHLRKAKDGRTHALGTGFDSQGSQLWFAKYFTPIAATDTITVGFRMKTQTTDRNIDLLKFMGSQEPQNHHVMLQLRTTRIFRLILGGGTQIDISAAGAFSANTWHYVELSTLTNNTTGTYELKVDGISVFSGSGVDTEQNANYGPIGGIEFASPTHSGAGAYDEAFLLDDIYILDDTGSLNTTFLGPISIYGGEFFEPVAETFSTYGGEEHLVANIQNVPFDSTSGIESTNTATTKQMYTLLPFHTGGIIGITMSSRAGNKTGFTVVNVKHRIESGVSNDNSGNYNIVDSDAHRSYFSTLEGDPNTSALWTQSNLNDATFGVEIG